jgi:two-component system, LytTR family, response regulator
MIKCVIIDDEQSAINVLKRYVQDHPETELVGSTTNPLEGLRIIGEQQPDVVLLDIEMPELNGLDMVVAIGGRAKIIITTAYADYALKGFELDVVDYMMKPVSMMRFVRSIEKAKMLLEVQKQQLEPHVVERETNFIVLRGEGKGKYIKIDTQEIDYIEGLRNYVSIHCADKRYLTLANLKDLEEKLPANEFFRVHKSFIVSLRQVKSLDGNTIFLKNNPREDIILSQTYREHFLKAFKAGMIG